MKMYFVPKVFIGYKASRSVYVLIMTSFQDDLIAAHDICE